MRYPVRRGGGGAPLKSDEGEVLADLRERSDRVRPSWRGAWTTGRR